MSSEDSNLYSAPDANLVSNIEGEHPVLKYKRFTAWGVFALSFLTMGFYGYYWIINRATTTNLIQERKFKKVFAYLAVILGVLGSILTSSGAVDPMLAMAGLGLTLIGGAFYLYSLFAMRSRIKDIVNTGASTPVKVGPIMTFFFNVIYLQYKINQSIDFQKALSAQQQNIVQSTAPLKNAA